MSDYAEDIWNRIDAANIQAGIFRDWSVSEKDQLEALADDLNRQLLAPKRANTN